MKYKIELNKTHKQYSRLQDA